jgi:hypothetical protein
MAASIKGGYARTVGKRVRSATNAFAEPLPEKTVSMLRAQRAMRTGIFPCRQKIRDPPQR